MSSKFLVTALVSVVMLAGCGGGSSGGSPTPTPTPTPTATPTPTPTPTPTRTLASIQLSPTHTTIPLGQTVQFNSTAVYDNGEREPVTGATTWTSSDATVATISNDAGSAGLASAQTTGVTTITASYQGVTETAQLTVSDAAVMTLTVSPTSESVPAGRTVSYTAAATFTDGSASDVTTSATWTSSSPNSAPISNDAGTEGVATGRLVGNYTLTASFGGATASATLEVTPAVIDSIRIDPNTASLEAGAVTRLEAIATKSNGGIQFVTSDVVWSSSDDALVTVSNTAPNQGRVTAVAEGVATITATIDGHSGSAEITVLTQDVTSLEVLPATAAVDLGLTQAFTAMATYADGRVRDVTQSVTWSSADEAIATVSNESGSEGVAQSLTVGDVAISAAIDDQTGSASLTVNPKSLVHIDVLPGEPSVPKGRTQQFFANGTYTDESAEDLTTQVSWTSGNANLATVSNTDGERGLATTLATGDVLISATLNGVIGRTTMTVTPGILQSLSISPTDSKLPKDFQRQFSAFGVFEDGSSRDVTGDADVTWTSADTTVAQFVANGLVKAVAPGQAKLTVSSGSVSASLVLTVTDEVLQSISIGEEDAATAKAASPVVMLKGTDKQFSATGMFDGGSSLDLTDLVDWNSSDITMLEFSSSTPGFASALEATAADAPVSVTAMVSGIAVTGKVDVTVSDSRIVTLAIDPASVTIHDGLTADFKAYANLEDGTKGVGVTNAVSWTTDASDIVTVTNARPKGVAEAKAPGSAKLTVRDPNGQAVGRATVTVDDAVLRSLAITPAAPGVGVGLRTQLSAIGTFSDSSETDVTADASWVSSNTAIATVSNDPATRGTVTGVASGAAQITATLNGVTRTTTLTVVDAEIVDISLSVGSPGVIDGSAMSVPEGATAPLIATATLADGTMQTLVDGLTWASDAPFTTGPDCSATAPDGVANVDAAGNVTTVACNDLDAGESGFTTTSTQLYVYYDANGDGTADFSKVRTLNISAPIVSKVTLTTPSSTLPYGKYSMRIAAAVTMSDGSNAGATTADGGSGVDTKAHTLTWCVVARDADGNAILDAGGDEVCDSAPTVATVAGGLVVSGSETGRIARIKAQARAKVGDASGADIGPAQNAFSDVLVTNEVLGVVTIHGEAVDAGGTPLSPTAPGLSACTDATPTTSPLTAANGQYVNVCAFGKFSGSTQNFLLTETIKNPPSTAGWSSTDDTVLTFADSIVGQASPVAAAFPDTGSNSGTVTLNIDVGGVGAGLTVTVEAASPLPFP